MRSSLLLSLWLAALLPLISKCEAAEAPACLPITSDQISARDVTPAFPQFAAIPPDLTLGHAPTPGIVRVIQAYELQRLAKRYAILTTIKGSVCFAWPLHPLTSAAIGLALKQSLAGRTVEMEVTDQSRAPVPDGDLIFPLEGLSGFSDRPTLWRGYVNYASGKRFDTWAMVHVTVHEQQTVLSRSIHIGEVIGVSDVRTESYSGPLRRLSIVSQSSSVVGMCANRPLALGTVLDETMFSAPKDVERQQTVVVHIYCGAAHIQTQGVAMDSGYRGATIHVRNPKTGRTFLAQITDRGVVNVVPGGDFGLVTEDKKKS